MRLRSRFFLLLCACLTLHPGWAGELTDHPSPYLAQHADDPVQWRSWRPQLLAQAQQEGKLLFISSGYFACHWCHVMQRESFRNPGIAALLNRFTIPVKLDRELQPALDAQLLAFVRKTRGHAGWPLNVFLTPEGYPLLGLVYAQPEAFHTLLVNLEQAWKEDPGELRRLAVEAAASERKAAAATASPQVSTATLLQLFDQRLWAVADELEGGFGNQSKFPNVPLLQTLLFLQQAQPDARRREFVQLTLRQMAGLGLRDHLGGGFFRYTTDPGWRSPHFEKMLYDNAQLLGLYAQSARLFQDKAWLQVAEQTFAFLQREMRAVGGGYIASLSAVDGEGAEGGYYLWSQAQLRELLTESQYRLARHWYGFSEAQSTLVDELPMRIQAAMDVQEWTGLSPAELQTAVQHMDHTLLQARKQRRLPRDEKVLAAWNGLLLKSLVQLAEATGNDEHRQAAAELRRFLVRHFWNQGNLYRLVDAKGYMREGELEDYAYVAAGLMAWCRFTGDEEDVELLQTLVESARLRFHSEQGWRLSEATPPGFASWHQVIEDGALPSPAAILLEVSGWLSSRAGEQLPMDTAPAITAGVIAENPLSYASYVPLLLQDKDLDSQPPE